jgi:hypothetical protein
VFGLRQKVRTQCHQRKKNADMHPRKNKQNKTQSPASHSPSFAEIVCENQADDTNFHPKTSTQHCIIRNARQNRAGHRRAANYYDQLNSENGRKIKPCRQDRNRNQMVRNQQGNLRRENGVTYIGRRVSQSFLGGGKPSRRQKFRTPRFQQ